MSRTLPIAPEEDTDTRTDTDGHGRERWRVVIPPVNWLKIRSLRDSQLRKRTAFPICLSPLAD